MTMMIITIIITEKEIENCPDEFGIIMIRSTHMSGTDPLA
jgi:hypothetical protein